MNVHEGIMQGLQEALEHAEGKRELHTVKLTSPSVEPVPEFQPEEIRKIRFSLDMTQSIFASFMGVSPKTIEAWEAGKNIPDGPARRILSMVQSDPQLPQKYRIITSA